VSVDYLNSSTSDKRINLYNNCFIGYEEPFDKGGLGAFINANRTREKPNCIFIYDKITNAIWVKTEICIEGTKENPIELTIAYEKSYKIKNPKLKNTTTVENLLSKIILQIRMTKIGLKNL